MNSQQIQQAIILIGVILLITLCTVFSQSAFSDLSVEANGGIGFNASADASTYNAGSQSHSYIYVIGLLLILAVIILAMQLVKKSATS
jgi:hypothetical protein